MSAEVGNRIRLRLPVQLSLNSVSRTVPQSGLRDMRVTGSDPCPVCLGLYPGSVTFGKDRGLFVFVSEHLLQ